MVNLIARFQAALTSHHIHISMQYERYDRRLASHYDEHATHVTQ